MITDTKRLFHHGLELGLKTWELAKETLGWTVDDLDYFMIHQVGKAHTETFARILGIDLKRIFRPKMSDSRRRSAPTPCALGTFRKPRQTSGYACVFFKCQCINVLAPLTSYP